MTKKCDVITTMEEMLKSTNKDDQCWTRAEFIIQEWADEHKPAKKPRKVMESTDVINNEGEN